MIESQFSFNFRLVKRAFRIRYRTLSIKQPRASISEADVFHFSNQFESYPLKLKLERIVKIVVQRVCPTRLKIDKQKEQKYLDRGVKKIGKSLDVVTLIKTQKRLKALENFLFTKPQRNLLRMNRWNYLSQNSSSSSCSEYPDFKQLEGVYLREETDTKLYQLAIQPLPE